MLPRLALRIAALLPLAALPALAQYSIRNIAIRGGAPYTDAEVLEVSGLQPGQMMTRNSLANAAQHLLDTGIFADAEVSLSGSGLARTVNIGLKPLSATAMARATFANLVWWTPAELDTELRHRIPFYRGGIPAAGNLPDSVNAALTAMLTAKGIHASVSNTQVQPTNAHPELTWEFCVDDPAIRLASIHLSGAPAALAPALQRTINRLTNSSYAEGSNGFTVQDALLQPLRNAGYIDAQLTNIKRDVTQTGTGYAVIYSAALTAGDAWHIGTLTWQPTSIYTQDAFAHDAKLHPGDLAAAQSLLVTEQAILNAYLHLGYLDAYISATPQQNTATHTVSYTLAIVPGDIYHLHTVTPLDLSPDAQKDFDFGWKLKPGDAYDPLYAAGFLTSNTALRNLAPYTASFQAAADPQTHLVDLTIKFIRVNGL